MLRTRHVTLSERSPGRRAWTVEDHDGDRIVASRELWIKLAPPVAPPASRLDAPLLGLAAGAAYDGRALVLHGAVSHRLLEGVAAVIHEGAATRPHLWSVVRVEASSEVEAPAAPPSAPAVVAFDGSLEAASTVMRHLRPGRGERHRSVRALAVIDGLDIPLEKPDRGEKLLREVRAAAAALDPALAVIGARTNLRGFAPTWERDPEVAGLARAAVLAELAGSWPHGLVPGSGGPLPSAEDARVARDAPWKSTLARARRVAPWTEILGVLRVCAEARAGGANCGRCEPCVRGLAAFRALGVPRIGGLSEPGDAVFRAVAIGDGEREAWREIVDVARVRTPGPWVDAVREALGERA